MSDEKNRISEPLIKDGVDGFHEENITLTFQRCDVWKTRFYVLLGVTLMAMVATGFFIMCLLPGTGYRMSAAECETGIQAPYTPAAGHDQSELRWLLGDPDTPKFIGKPRQETDQAWHSLLEATLIRVSAEELEAANATSIPLGAGGYGAGLGVSHSLHCIKRIKQFMYPDYYYNHEVQNWDELKDHVEHCLESLRQSVLCNIDTSLYTLEWTPHSKYKPAVRVPQPHRCTNWDALHEWMKTRAARLDDLVRPEDTFFQ